MIKEFLLSVWNFSLEKIFTKQPVPKPIKLCINCKWYKKGDCFNPRFVDTNLVNGTVRMQDCAFLRRQWYTFDCCGPEASGFEPKE